MMKIDVLSLFPPCLKGYSENQFLKKAAEKEAVNIRSSISGNSRTTSINRWTTILTEVGQEWFEAAACLRCRRFPEGGC